MSSVPEPPPKRVEITVSPRTIATVLAVVAFVWAFVAARQAVLWVFIALFLAIVLQTPVTWLEERARMRLILRGKSLGFSLREIKDFLDLYNVDPMHRVQHEALLHAVRDRMNKLERMQTAIAHTLEELQAIEHQTAELLSTPHLPGHDEAPLKSQPRRRA